MKRLVIALAALVVMGGGAASAADKYTVEWMLHGCELALLDPDNLDIGELMPASNCQGFIMGVVFTMATYERMINAKAGVELPPRVCYSPFPGSQGIIQAFVNTARAHPEWWLMSAADLAVQTITTTWPCSAQ